LTASAALAIAQLCIAQAAQAQDSRGSGYSPSSVAPISLDLTDAAIKSAAAVSPGSSPGSSDESAPSGVDNPIAQGAEPSPTGAAGPSWGHHHDHNYSQGDFLPLPDRWRIGVPGNYVLNVKSKGRYFDPYNQNVLKGDYPIFEDDKFLVVTLISDTILEYRKLPIPSGVSTADANRVDFFGFGDQYLFVQNVVVSLEFFEGAAAYKPRDFEFRLTPVAQINYVDLEELSGVDPDVREGTSRQDEWIGLQEAFAEKHLSDLSTNYDFWSIRVGIQGFASDFRGFMFADNNLGVRLFGTADSNRINWNLAYFHQLEKDTNSGLNSYTFRDQDIFIANVFFQDCLAYFRPQSMNDILFGYTTQFSFHANFDHGEDGEFQLDDNGRIVRPAPVGTVQSDNANEIRAYYLGWAGDGHIGRLNLSHQFYWALGEETFNPIAGREVDINAQFFAVELSYDQDWIRYRAAFVYASGDDDVEDGDANGFDSIFDNPQFFGGGNSFFVRQQIPLVDTGLNLFQRNSFLPDLRTSKEQGQANFVNPGLFVYNIGADIEVTPKTRVILNASYIMFDSSDTLKVLLHDNKLGNTLGIDYSIGVQYRPFLNQNAIFSAGFAAFQPLGGYKDIFQSDMQYSIFLGMTWTY